jgi:hypothetical protein
MGLFVTGLLGNEDDLRRAVEQVTEAVTRVQYNEEFGVFMVDFGEETPQLNDLKDAVTTNSFACIIAPDVRFVYTLRELDGLTYDEVKQMVKDDERQNLERVNYFVAYA